MNTNVPAQVDGFPRRNRLDHLTPIETQARQLVLDIEVLGCHPLLTDAVNAVHAVREKLADWVDAGKPGEIIQLPGLERNSEASQRRVPRYPNGEDQDD